MGVGCVFDNEVSGLRCRVRWLIDPIIWWVVSLSSLMLILRRQSDVWDLFAPVFDP